jgi:hypothetical protein
MQAFIDNFILSLGLGVNSYTLLVLNRKSCVAPPHLHWSVTEHSNTIPGSLIG